MAMALRTVQLYDTLFDADGKARVGATISAVLFPPGNAIRFNVAGDPLAGTSVDQEAVQTTTAGSEPATQPSLTMVGGSGPLLQGNYSYGVSFLARVQGISELVESAITDLLTVVVSQDNSGVQIDNIPVGDASYGNVVARRFYRTPKNQLVPVLLATLEDNFTTSYTDVVPDISLGVDPPLQLGGWRLHLVAPGDVLPANLIYHLTIDDQRISTTSFLYTASPVLASVLFSRPASHVVIGTS